jgi:hypothetical protein
LSNDELPARVAVYARYSRTDSAERQQWALLDVAADGLELAFVEAPRPQQEDRPEPAQPESGRFDTATVDSLDLPPRDAAAGSIIRSPIEAGEDFAAIPWVGWLVEQRRAAIERCKIGREAAKRRRAAIEATRPAFCPDPKHKIERQVTNAVRKLYDAACDAGVQPETMAQLLNDFVQAYSVKRQQQESRK